MSAISTLINAVIYIFKGSIKKPASHKDTNKHNAKAKGEKSVLKKDNKLSLNDLVIKK